MMSLYDFPDWYLDMVWEPCTNCDGNQGWNDIEGDWIECSACEGDGGRWVGIDEAQP